MTRYRVVAPYVTARSTEAARQVPWPQATAISGYNAGAILPESVPADDIAHMLAAGLIEPVPEPA